jgi:hypothetical protein
MYGLFVLMQLIDDKLLEAYTIRSKFFTMKASLVLSTVTTTVFKVVNNTTLKLEYEDYSSGLIAGAMAAVVVSFLIIPVAMAIQKHFPLAEIERGLSFGTESGCSPAIAVVPSMNPPPQTII